MRFAQATLLATLWIFSMRAADVGALLPSARLDLILQRRRFRVKDWPYSQAATLQVCDLLLTFVVFAALFVLVMLGRVVRVLWEEARFELPLPCCWLLMRFAQEGFTATLWIFFILFLSYVPRVVTSPATAPSLTRFVPSALPAITATTTTRARVPRAQRGPTPRAGNL